MTMRKKDYEAIAKAINDTITRLGTPPTGREMFVLFHVANSIRDYCEHENPKFKGDRFLADCGVSQ